MFKNPFSFNGRIRRLEYGLSYLIYLIVYIGVAGLIASLGDSFSLLIFIIWIPLLWFLLTQGSKRWHDRGNSGWYQIIPFYGLWMLFANSDYGPNEYGPNPKGKGNNEDINYIGKTIDYE